MYFDCAVEDEASTTTEPSTDQEQSGGQGWGSGLGQGMGRARGQGMGSSSGHGQDVGSGLGQVWPSGLPEGLPDDAGESDGMLCYGIFPAESVYKPI